MKPIITEKEYWGIFEISILIKGLASLAELIGGTILWFADKAVLVTYILNNFQNLLSDDPKDYIATLIVNSAASLAVSSQYFFGAYLFLHGIVKIFLLAGLYRKKIWAYPVSIVIFSLLVFYESYSFYIGHSMWVLSFTLLDILVVLLTGHEYGVLRKKQKSIKN